MAQRRMFSLQIVDTDAFMDMPLSAQALYFHLGMRADDDGFVSNARRVQKLVGAADDDLKLLLMKRFILAFDSGVIVLKHWKISNYIQKDRYRPTLYKEEKSTLYLKPDGAYTDHPVEGAKPCLPQSVYDMDTDCIHRIGEDSLGKVREGKVNNSTSGDDARAEAERTVTDFLSEQGNLPSMYFGVTDESMNAVRAFAEAVFRQWTTRRLTEDDVARVFFAIREQVRNSAGETEVTFPQNSKELLMYAFEQAAAAGRPGDWNYIDGVLRNLRLRNIQTLADAENYDYERRSTK